MLRSLSSSSLKEVVTKYLMSQPAKEVRVHINSFFNCAGQIPRITIENLIFNDCRLKSLFEIGTAPGQLCSSQESSSLTQILLPHPMTYLLFWTPGDLIFVIWLFISIYQMWKTVLFLKSFKRSYWMLILTGCVESTNSGRRGESSLKKEVGCPS